MTISELKRDIALLNDDAEVVLYTANGHAWINDVSICNGRLEIQVGVEEN